MANIMNPAVLPGISSKMMKGAFAVLPQLDIANVEQPGARGLVGKYCKEKGYKRALVVTGPHIGKSELSKKLYSGLDEEGIEYTIFDGVKSDPVFSGCKAGSDMAKANHVDVVIAFGGGSVLDTAKIIAGTLAYPDSPFARFTVPFTVFKQFPLITIPTTAGTGCEVTFGSVISDDKTHMKRGVGGPGYTPQISFLDVETTMDLSPKMTAATGMDAMSHVVENYLSAVPDKACKAMCKKAIKDIFEYLPRAYHNGVNDMEARVKMMECARVGGISINRSGAVHGHALAHAIGGVYHLPHGEICGTILPEIVRFYQIPCAPQLARLAIYCGLGTVSEDRETLAARLVDHVFALRKELDLPEKIKGMNKYDLEAVKKEFWTQAMLFPSPVSMTEAELDAILYNLAEN